MSDAGLDIGKVGRLRHDLPKLYGSWAVITGASDGMGLAMAERLAHYGMNLAIVARREALLIEIAARLSERHGVEVKALSLDLAKATDVERLISETEDLDTGLLVAAAGFGSCGPLLDQAIASEAEMVDVNCRAVLALTHAFAQRFRRRRRGAIVLFGSIVGWQGVPYSANYSATKAYIQSLAEALRVELSPFGVDVLCAAPGPVSSGFARRAGMHMDAATPAQEVAAAVVASLGRSGTIIPGRLGKILTWSLAPLPRSLRIRIMTGVMRGMAGHHGAEEHAAARSA